MKVEEKSVKFLHKSRVLCKKLTVLTNYYIKIFLQFAFFEQKFSLFHQFFSK